MYIKKHVKYRMFQTIQIYIRISASFKLLYSVIQIVTGI